VQIAHRATPGTTQRKHYPCLQINPKPQAIPGPW
jgi:hypothetical protein